MLKPLRYFFNKLIINLAAVGLIPGIAYADVSSTGSAAVSSGSSQIIMTVFLFGLMYFFILRPQTKKAKEHGKLIASIISGDEVITIGGLVGKVQKVLDNFVILRIANDVEVKIQKQAISQILPNNTINSL